MIRKNWLIALSIIALAAGCGYSTRSLVSTHIKTIHVVPFKNKISYTTERQRNLYFPLVEVKVHNEVVDRFLFDGNLDVVNDLDAADVVLKGELVDYERIPLRYSDNDDVEEYRIHIIVSLSLWDNQEQKMLWTEPSFAGETTYFTTGPQATPESTAIQDAITDLARRIVERTIEDW